jgi:hypothetical protein
MSTLVDFIDLRFGDPVLALALAQDGMAYGTGMGSIYYYSLRTYAGKMLKESSREPILGLNFHGNQTLVGTVGNFCGILFD